MADYYVDLPPTRTDQAKPGSRDYAIIEWCEDRLHHGRKFVESQVGYERIDAAIKSVFAHEREASASYIPVAVNQSRTRVNLAAKTAEDLVAQMTDARVFWDYATNNPRYEAQARLANKEAEEWYTSRLIDLRFGDIIRYYTVGGTGFAHLYYNRRINDMMVEALDPRTVFPIEPISYHTLQDARGVAFERARSPEWVREEYQKVVSPDIGRGGSMFGWLTRTISNVSRGKLSGPLSRRGSDTSAPVPDVPTVFVKSIYLHDNRVNKTNQVQFMGRWEDANTPLTQWSYKVAPGAPLYPFGRLIVWGGGALLEDGPSPYWHSEFPIIKLTLNPWPMSWFGKAPLWDVLPLNESMNALLRVIDDHAAQVAQPGVIADRNVSKAELMKFNSRTPGYQIRTNMASGKGIQVQTPPPLDQSLWEHVHWIEQMIQKLAGTTDAGQLAQLSQIPSNDTIDTLMKAMTPGVRLRSRILEGFMREVAHQYLYCIAEFDTLSKRVARFGPSAVTREDFDYDPRTFVPDDVPDGEPGDIAATEDGLGLENPRPMYVRANEMLKSFTYNYKPGSLLNSAAQQDRMEDLLLSKMGYLSVFTLMEDFGKMNFAPPSIQVPNSELERLQLQQQLGIGMIANAQGRKATNAEAPRVSDAGAGDVTLQTS